MNNKATRRAQAPEKKTKAEAPGRRGRGRAGAAHGDSLNAYIREIAQFKPLASEDEKVLGRRIQRAIRRPSGAWSRPTSASWSPMPSATAVSGLSFLDLIHEGTLGLMEAAKRFDPERNVRFISYAVWWVRQAIFHALSEHARSSGCPRSCPARSRSSSTCATPWPSSCRGRPPPPSWPRSRELSEGQVEALLRAGGDDVSLSAAVGDDGTLELGDTLEQETIPSAELELIRTSFETQIQNMVSDLEPKEREVIRMRFGLDGDESENPPGDRRRARALARARASDREQGQGEAAPEPRGPGAAGVLELICERCGGTGFVIVERTAASTPSAARVNRVAEGTRKSVLSDAPGSRLGTSIAPSPASMRAWFPIARRSKKTMAYCMGYPHRGTERASACSSAARTEWGRPISRWPHSPNS
jgi:RNA polymerase primary sigma factor